MSTLALAIVLQLAGVLVVIAEIIIPSGGIISVVALGLFGYSLYMVFTELSAATGMVFLALDVVTIPILILTGLKMLARSPATLKTQLSRNSGVVSQAKELAGYLGHEGTAVSDLRPAGVAEIDGRRVDVVSRGDFIERGSAVVVSAVTGNQIIVRKKESHIQEAHHG